MKTKQLILYGIITVVFVIGKLLFSYSDNTALLFILKPLSGLIALFTNASFVFLSEAGFYAESLNISIDKSCSGVNFWLISFVVISFSVIQKNYTIRKKLMYIPFIIIITYVLTLIANTSRILTAILIDKKINFNAEWLHQAEGVFIYLSFLIVTYLIVNNTKPKAKTL